MDSEETKQLTEKWGHVMNDPTVEKLSGITMGNYGIPYEDEDFNESLKRFGEGKDYFTEIYNSL